MAAFVICAIPYSSSDPTSLSGLQPIRVQYCEVSTNHSPVLRPVADAPQLAPLGRGVPGLGEAGALLVPLLQLLQAARWA